MEKTDHVKKVAGIIVRLRADIDELKSEGESSPAVQKNAIRLSGTLRTLEIQYNDTLAALGDGNPG